MTDEAQGELGLGTEVVAQPNVSEVIGLFIAGQGSDTPELHVRFNGRTLVMPLTNPVTASQIADIIASLS